MPSLRAVSDYINAVNTAARRRLFRYPYAIYSVLSCRFRYGLGPKFHSLFNLGGLPRERWNDYLENDRLRAVLRLINQPAGREVVNDKLLFHAHCVAHSLPTIPVICAIQGRDSNHPETDVIAMTEREWCDRLDVSPDRLFIKPIDGTWGRGAFVAKRLAQQWKYEENLGSAAMLHASLKRRMDGKRGWMVQPLIEAHQSLRSITSSQALPTIRANTCIVEGEPRLLYAMLRIPVGANVTDNFAHGTTGNIVAPIDIDSGRLGKCRGSASTK
jgi:hypothetical protein